MSAEKLPMQNRVLLLGEIFKAVLDKVRNALKNFAQAATQP